MEVQEFWVREGRIVPRSLGENGQPHSDRFLLQQRDHVKIEIGAQAITIRWNMASANWASLFFTKEWIGAFEGPFHLSFFNAGWFEEVYDTPMEAKKRINHLVAKADLHLPTRVFTRDFLGSSAPVANELLDLLESGGPDEEKAVRCDVDINNGKVDVQDIGKRSVLAGIWGEARVSYPCQTGHSYDRIVSKAYFRALNENRPVYDQVLASMVKPDGNIQWIGYHRVIFPRYDHIAKTSHVLVNCALAPVDIQLF